jgi:hypothetical protein
LRPAGWRRDMRASAFAVAPAMAVGAGFGAAII